MRNEVGGESLPNKPEEGRKPGLGRAVLAALVNQLTKGLLSLHERAQREVPQKSKDEATSAPPPENIVKFHSSHDGAFDWHPLPEGQEPKAHRPTGVFKDEPETPKPRNP